MMIVNELANGVFRVELTDSHKEGLDASVKSTGCAPMAVLGMWIAAGVVELAFAEAENPLSKPLPKSLDRGPDCDDT